MEKKRGKKKHFLENINIHLCKPPEMPAIFSNKFALLIHQKKVIQFKEFEDIFTFLM